MCTCIIFVTMHMKKLSHAYLLSSGEKKQKCLLTYEMHLLYKLYFLSLQVLHYGQELFEGMKAYRGADDRVRLFRPMHNMARMNVTARRACLPTFEGRELLECIRRLVAMDQEWVPHSESAALYIRPAMIGVEPTLRVANSNEVLLFVLTGPVGPYYATGKITPVIKNKKTIFICLGNYGNFLTFDFR